LLRRKRKWTVSGIGVWLYAASMGGVSVAVAGMPRLADIPATGRPQSTDVGQCVAACACSAAGQAPQTANGRPSVPI